MVYNNVLFPGDVTGTGVWRLLWPQQMISRDKDIVTSILNRPVLDPNYYIGMNMMMFQRLVADDMRNIFERVLLPAAKRFGIWIIANVDDCLHKDEIPEFNVGRPAYNTPTAFDNVKFTMQNSDLVVCSTDIIRDYYIEKFGINPEKIIKIPNYLPEWEFAGKYNERHFIENWNKHGRKPRVGIVSSASHYNMDKERVELKDDFDIIANLVKSTVDRYQWVFFGHLPHQVQELHAAGKVEHCPGSDIYNYPLAFSKLNLNCVVAPLVDITFNRCKSNIKILEASALGIPFFVQNLSCYSPYTKYTFNDEKDLGEKLEGLFKFRAVDAVEIIRNNYKKLVTPHKEGNGWWLTANSEVWERIFKTEKNSVRVSYKEFIKRTDKGETK